MRGEFTLKVRSTPTPLRTERTVIDRLMPPPRRRMTVPSKTWMRSRLPSLTRAETLTVSPDASAGRSVRIWSAVISSMTLKVSYSLMGARADRPLAVLRVGRRSIHASLDEVRATRFRARVGLLATPLVDGAMVATQQDVRHSGAVELRGSRVLRVLQQPVGEGLVDGRLCVDRARQQPEHGVN